MIANTLTTIVLGNNMLYIDPATTTVLLSSLTSIIVSLGAVFLIWGRSIKKYCVKIFKLNENSNKEVEQDIVVKDQNFNYDKEAFLAMQGDAHNDKVELEEKPQIQIAPPTLTRKQKFFNEERKKRVFPTALVLLGIVLLAFVVAPLEIYANNIEEFTFAVIDFLPMCIVYGVAFGIVCFCAMYFSPKCVYKVMYALAVGSLLMLLLQTNFLNFGLNSVEGDNNTSNITLAQKIISTCIWAVVLGGFITAMFVVKKPNVMRTICLVLTFAITFSQVVSGVVIASSKDLSASNAIEKRLETDPDYMPSFMTNKNINRISTNQNVYVFLIDRFDGKMYAEPALNKETLTQEEWNLCFGQLDGFTYFTDYVALYGRTYPAVPSMLSTFEWTFDKDSTEENPIHSGRIDYYNTTYQQNNTLIKLDKLGYDVNVYTDGYYCYDDAYDFYYEDEITGEKIHYVDNIIQVPKRQVKKKIMRPAVLPARMLQMSFYRSFPFITKGIGNGINSATCNSMVEYDFGGNNNYDKWLGDMKILYNELNVDTYDTTTNKNFSFVHFSGTHEVNYDANFENFRGDDEENMHLSVINSFKIINKFIDKLKDAGMYEDSTIIIVGDHSHPHDDYSAIDLTEKEEARITGLFVKPSFSSSLYDGHSGLNYSNAQVAQANLWSTIFKSAGIALTDEEQEYFGRDFFDIEEGETVERKHIWQIQNILYTNFTETVYTITGRADEMGKDADGNDVLINWIKGEDVFFDHSHYN